MATEPVRSRPILVVGVPRSGTTWVARTLQTAAGARVVGEPDNEDNFAYAIKAKRRLGRYPIVLPGEQPPEEYVALWAGAFAGGRAVAGPLTAASKGLHYLARSGHSVHGAGDWSAPRRAVLRSSVALARPCRPARGQVLVKTVFAPFALGWLRDKWHPRVVLVVRSPVSTVASWHRRGWDRPFHGHPQLGGPDAGSAVLDRLLGGATRPQPPAPTDEIGRLSWELAVMMEAIRQATAGDDSVLFLDHEHLCAAPDAGFHEAFDALGLRWTTETSSYLRASDAPGDGAYDTTRVTQDQPTRWASTFTEQQAARVREVVAGFGGGW